MLVQALDESLSLRMLRLQDAEALFAVVDANRAHLREWLPWLDENTGPDDSRRFIQSTLDQCAADTGFVCAVLFDGAIVGTVGFNTIRWSSRCAELGYWLAADCTGRGLMTRSCEALIDYAFGELGLHKVEIRAATGNLRSRAVPERLGFFNEGVLRETEWLYDHYVDHVVYGLLSREWAGSLAARRPL